MVNESLGFVENNNTKEDFLMKLTLTAVIFTLLSFQGLAEGEAMHGSGSDEGASLFGDFRFRYLTGGEETTGANEADYGGSQMQFRFRAGVKYRLSEKLSFKGRLRTDMEDVPGGSYQNMGGDFRSKNVGLDLAYVKGKMAGIKLKLGKQPLPFWKQNEVYWDNDVTPEGITLSKAFKGADKAWKVRPVLGYYIIRSAGFVNDKEDREGEPDFKDNEDATMLAVQINGKLAMGSNSKLKWGVGMLNMENLPLQNDEDVTKDGREYSLMIASLKWASRGDSLGVWVWTISPTGVMLQM